MKVIYIFFYFFFKKKDNRNVIHLNYAPQLGLKASGIVNNFEIRVTNPSLGKEEVTVTVNFTHEKNKKSQNN